MPRRLLRPHLVGLGAQVEKSAAGRQDRLGQPALAAGGAEQPAEGRRQVGAEFLLGDAGLLDQWTTAMDASAELYEALRTTGLDIAAPYAVSMAYRVRFYMEMNAREAMHLIELRTAPQGHPAYRRVCQQMHTLIAERAGHRGVAAAMRFADHTAVELERLKAERALEQKRLGARP